MKVDEDEGGGARGFHDSVPDEIWLSIIRQRIYLFTLTTDIFIKRDQGILFHMPAYFFKFVNT